MRRLRQAIVQHIEDGGDEIISSHERASDLAAAWLGYLRDSQSTDTANELLDGFHASLIEAAGCLAMGLIRPAIFAMRTQVDILFAWLFFKDHPVEWQHLESTGDKYRLVSEVIRYLRTYNRRFQDRFSLLRRHRTGGYEDPYRLLSAHVHAQNTATVPPLVEIHQLVQEKDRCLDCIQLQLEISEYLSDILTACFARQWIDLPESVTTSINCRLRAADVAELCAP